MNEKMILQEAHEILEELQGIRRQLHQHPEVGFDLSFTKAFVNDRLEEMGYMPQEMGKAGLVVTIEGDTPGKTILLRADMDALAIHEEAEVEFASKEEGKMHACGHDMHTAMLLGAAKILKKHKKDIAGTIKLEFQPAEEIFQGSLDMISAGLLENPHVDAAMMLHVIAGMPMKSGVLLVPQGGISAASCEQYHITVKGKGGHGSSPQNAIDPITAAAQMHIAMQEINSRELDANDYGVFTTCHFEAGTSSNVIPDTAQMWGTIRTIDPENKIGEYIKTRMSQICSAIGAAFRCETDIEFYDYCPCMMIQPELSKASLQYMRELFGDNALDLSLISGGKAGGGSEDFAFVSHHVPTISMFISAGNSSEGYVYGQHHPKVKYDDSILDCGAAAYAYMALRWLQEHSIDQ